MESKAPDSVLPRWIPVAHITFVCAVWLFMGTANLAIVYRYSPPTMPVSDELQELGGGADLSWSWLWQQHAEHRIPLSKLLWLGTLRLTDYDYRIGNLAEVMAVQLLALALILTIRRIRGETRWTDAFFALALLNFGQTYPVFLWWWQVNHTLPPLLACLVLMLLAKKPLPDGTSLVLLGILLILLSVSGPGGLPYVPPLALWLAWAAIRSCWSDSSGVKWQSVVTLLLTIVASTFVVMYFVEYDKDLRAIPPADLKSAEGINATLKAVAKLLSVSVGTLTRPAWVVWGCLVALFWLCGGVLAMAGWLRQAEERVRAAGLLLFLVGNAMLLLAVGWARANYGDHNTFEGHYLLKGVPALCCVYFIFDVYARPRLAGELQAGLFLLVLIPTLFLIRQSNAYLIHAQTRRDTAEAMDQDIRAGRSPYWLLQRYKTFHGIEGEAPRIFAQSLENLREMGVPPFSSVPREKEVPYYGTPDRHKDVVQKNGTWEAVGSDPSLVYLLPDRRFVSAILVRIKYLRHDAQPPHFQLFWKDPADGFAEERSVAASPTADGTEKTIAIPVGAVIDGFRIDPATQPCVFQIVETVLVVPDPSP